MVRAMDVIKVWIKICAIFIILIVTRSAYGRESRITEIRSWAAGEYTRIVFDLDAPVTYKATEDNKSHCINIDFSECINATSRNSFTINDDLVKGLFLKKSNNKKTTAQIKLCHNTDYKIFTLLKYRNKPDRVVIDISNPKFHNKEEEILQTIQNQKENNWIIVIDPGHGGEDPGAIVKRRYKEYKEKDIVLNVARELKAYLDLEPNIKAYLTRTGDYYLPLKKRVEIAHKYQADLFVSLHVNASKKSSAYGASVYYLSQKGVSDKASQLLANRENASDLIGGVDLSQEEDDYLSSILIDLAQTYTLNESITLGQVVLDCLLAIEDIKKDGPDGLKCGNFAVLKSPSIPSILIELSYLTNNKDLKLLTNKKYQGQMGQHIAMGIKKSLNARPQNIHQAPHKVAKTHATQEKYKVHTVKKGENLWRLATYYKVNLSYLMSVNNIKDSSHIRIGQKLKIPIL
ncbi:MAG: N-acetylmuramoyl-L-alanine amidase [bacterium]